MTRAESSERTVTMEPKEWFIDEMGLSFWDVFNIEGFVPDTQGFITMAEDEAGYANEMGVHLRPLDVALFLIDWWKAKELRA